LTSPYLVLHCEEFAWPRLLPSAPVRSYFKPLWGRTVSPITRCRGPEGRAARWLVCSLLHLSSSGKEPNRPKAGCAPKPDAQPLAGSLPC